jgi:hypothetical protein
MAKRAPRISKKYPSVRDEALLVREESAVYEARSSLLFANMKNMGTFADSKTAPIHGWFQYPAGFSYRGVECLLDLHGIRPGHRVYDPFAGTGTTNVVCKWRCIESIGVEAHPFVCKVARVKTTWDFDFEDLESTAAEFTLRLEAEIPDETSGDLSEIPELVRKCFSPPNLRRLLFIRQAINELRTKKYRDLFSLALTCALRHCSAAATGWPYIAPRKRIREKDGLECFIRQLSQMIADLESTSPIARKTSCDILQSDARGTDLPEGEFDFSFTSPPYLNNYDYADRTRLEGYFNGQFRSWGEITEKVRNRLMISATTQINRSLYTIEDIVSETLKSVAPTVAMEVQKKVLELAEKRLGKGGKKSYDIMVGQYFNDMALALKESFRLLKPGACFVLILGDSAPYGIHVPTEQYLAQIALGLGFREASVRRLRTRGEKWRGNPQRHHVPLQECILTLKR